MHIKSTIPLLAALVFTPAQLPAQGCCGVGSSLVAGGHPSLEKGTVFAQPGGSYTSAEKPQPYRSDATLALAYGITSRLAVSVKTNYAWLHAAVPHAAVVVNGNVLFPETTVILDNNGIGDGVVGTQFSIIPLTVLNKHELKVGLDLGIPWAEDQKIQDNAQLPKYMQTGSGAFTTGGFISYYHGFPAQRLGASATAAGRVKFKNRREEDPGDELSVMLSALAGPFWKTRESVSLNYKTTGATIDATGAKETSTSGSRIDIIPSLELTFTEHVKATIDAEVPVWRDANQKRFGTNLALRGSMLFFIPVLRN